MPKKTRIWQQKMYWIFSMYVNKMNEGLPPTELRSLCNVCMCKRVRMCVHVSVCVCDSIFTVFIS